MFRKSLLLFVLVLFAGCSSTSKNARSETPASHVTSKPSNRFEREDSYETDNYVPKKQGGGFGFFKTLRFR